MIDLRKLGLAALDHLHLPLACLCAGALGWLLHRPAVKVEEHTVTKTETKTVSVVDQQAVESEVQRRLQAELLKVDRHVRIVTVRKPDGTVIQTKTADSSLARTTTASDTRESAAASETHSASTSVATASTETSRVLTPVEGKWSGALLVGVEPLHLLAPRAYGPLELGAHLQLRVLGPVQVGAWALYRGGSDLSVGVSGGFQW